MSIVIFAEALTQLRKTSSVSESDLGLLNMLHLQVEQAVKEWLGYNVETASYTEFYPLRDHGLWEYGVTRNGKSIHLRQRPVTAITQIDEDSDGYFGQGSNAFASTTTLTEGTDYIWPLDYDSDGDNVNDASRMGKVIRLNEGWTTAPGSIQVQYTAGWTQATIPQDIRQGVLATLADWWSRISSTGTSGRIVQSERLGDYSVTFVTDKDTLDLQLPNRAVARLMPWRRNRFV